MKLYYVGLIVGAILATWIGTWEYTLFLINLCLLGILAELTIFANTRKEE